MGAGLSGAVIARELADAGHFVVVADQRDHVAGNCHTVRDAQTNVMVHLYGPHIFHTDDAEVWAYAQRFAELMPYRHRVKTTVGTEVYPLPINLQTINQFFSVNLSPEEAKAFVSAKVNGAINVPQSFEEHALKSIGLELYEAFLKGYTQKQWGLRPSALPAAVLKRLPLRFDENDDYFSHRFQGIPREGYTAMIAAMLDHPNIELRLQSPQHREATEGYSHVFNSGPIDAWFDHCLGRLGYRTLDFERLTLAQDFQGCAVMNYADESVPYTRITEHKFLSPWELHEGSVVYREYSRPAEARDIPYYPIRLVAENALLQRYVQMAEAQENITFVGRLGTYRYLDMDMAIREALDAARLYLLKRALGQKMPVFVQNPLAQL